ncbi:hydroxymethylglutaryl-CoA lyase [Pararhodospirillum photometricum]|uniref:hydroxymethylglutaryl-CoA lyase n=1 Tax=Pararhodospirillum photometricum DSM 122 TaxID=1150469 RepID=H6SMA9_PARPM|nr:hydroxymethylglutaryl-CoA lyase [Pararhodospirillum photometricum]CCG06792.1 Isopropylmalate/homocitrate/citramalate synthase [Pararhodospirillum photometricum DSM 122]
MTASPPDRVRIVEVGPRDGLQNEPTPVPVAERIALIDALSAAGLPEIEVGSFVSPRWVPQMAGTDAVLAGLTRHPGTRYTVLVPNLKGLEAAQAAQGVHDIALFAAASESFSQRNINCSIAESLERLGEVASAARALGWRIRGYVSCVLGCPYEGAVPVAQVVRVAEALHALGASEISLGDTIGVGTPGQARALIDTLAASLPVTSLAAHFHDTYGQALANLLAVLDRGVRVVDSAVAGLGGCPYAKGASGNVATEDVLYMLDGLGLATGVDLEAVARAGTRLCAVLGRPTASKVARARFG